jgi:hypothetical protein
VFLDKVRLQFVVNSQENERAFVGPSSIFE